MSFKVVNISNPGTSIKFGSDDLDTVTKLFNGVTSGIPAVTIKSTSKFGFWDGIAYFRNQADSKNTTIRGQSNVPATDVDLRLPPIVANDVLTALGITNIFSVKQEFDSGLLLKAMSMPSNPASGLYHIVIDSADSHLKKINNLGTITDYDVASGGGEINTASNIGLAGVGIYKQKTGVNFELKKINAGSSSVTINDDIANNEVDINVVDSTTTLKGKVELATDGENAANVVVQGNDTRLSNSRTPTAHATSHKSGGTDLVKLDELAAPTDVATLNASTSAHGLLKKLSNVATEFINGQGNWTTPSSIPRTTGIVFVASDGSGDYTTLAAAITAQGANKEYKLNPGTHQITTQLAPALSNVLISGSGKDVTTLSFESGIGSTGAGIFWSGTIGSFSNLSSNTLRDGTTVVIASTTGYAAGDWVILKRNVQQVDDTSSTYDAEIRRIKSVDSGTNMTLDFGLYNDYNTSATAAIAEVTFASSVMFRDLTILDNRTTVSAVSEQGDIAFKYCKDLTFSNVKIKDAFFASLCPNSCLNVTLENVDYDTPRGVTGSVLNYGLHSIGCTTNLKIIGGSGNRCRHTIDTDVSSGTPGRTRNMVVVGMMSYNANSAHFNTHQGTVGVTFIGCGAIGGNLVPSGDTEMQGFGARSPTTFIGCFTEGTYAICADVYIDDNAAYSDQYPGGDRTSFIGCRFQNPQSDSGLGRGVRVFTNRGVVSISNCQFYNIPDEPIMIYSGTHQVKINDCLFSSCAGDVSSGSGLIRCTGTVTDLSITNNIMNGGTVPPNAYPLLVSTSVARLEFTGNSINGYTNKIPSLPAACTEVNIHDNPGLNPINKITNHTNTTNNTIGLYGGTTATPVLSTDYIIVGGNILLNSTGGTGVSITTKDGAGNTITSGATSLSAFFVPKGFKINFGAFSVAPTLTVYAI